MQCEPCFDNLKNGESHKIDTQVQTPTKCLHCLWVSSVLQCWFFSKLKVRFKCWIFLSYNILLSVHRWSTASHLPQGGLCIHSCKICCKLIMSLDQIKVTSQTHVRQKFSLLDLPGDLEESLKRCWRESHPRNKFIHEVNVVSLRRRLQKMTYHHRI